MPSGAGRWNGRNRMDALQPTELARQVEDALRHLYDYAYLQAHPLAYDLLEVPSDEARGRALQHLLIDAVQLLRPDSQVPFGSAPWRNYRYLYLRYVQVLDRHRVANDLGLSLRQSQRCHRQALDAISSLLADRLRKLKADGRPPGVRDRSRGSDPLDAGSSLRRELSHLASAEVAATADLVEVIRSVVATISPLARKRELEIGASLPSSLPPVGVDRGLLRQVLLNLLLVCVTHAVRSLDVAAELRGQQALCRIVIPPPAPTDRGTADTAEEVVQAIRLSDEYVVSRHLLEMRDGSVEVSVSSAASDHGIEVSFRVPVERILTVLVVDDNPDALQLFERYLETGPYRVLSATNGRDALDLARQRHPDVVLLDVMMPTQDGWEVLQTLKTDCDIQHTPVVVCSVLRQRDLALALGATELVTKPFTRQSLLAALRRCQQAAS